VSQGKRASERARATGCAECHKRSWGTACSMQPWPKHPSVGQHEGVRERRRESQRYEYSYTLLPWRAQMQLSVGSRLPVLLHAPPRSCAPVRSEREPEPRRRPAGRPPSVWRASLLGSRAGPRFLQPRINARTKDPPPAPMSSRGDGLAYYACAMLGSWEIL